MSTGAGRPALVMFGDCDPPWWLRPLRAGFRHCFLAVDLGAAWVVVDPLSQQTQLDLVAAGFDVAGFYRRAGCTVVATRVRAAAPRLAPIRPYSCVEAVKRVLGVHARGVVTPWQLYNHLCDGAGEPGRVRDQIVVGSRLLRIKTEMHRENA